MIKHAFTEWLSRYKIVQALLFQYKQYKKFSKIAYLFVRCG